MPYSPRTAECSLVFPPDPVWVRPAREAVRALVTSCGRADLVETAVLLTSEAVTNAVQACQAKACDTSISVFAEQLLAEDGIRVHVRDEAVGLPVLVTPEAESESGRGVMLISGGSDAWGVCHHGPGQGKATWFQLGRRHR